MVIHDGIRDYWVSYLRRQPHAVFAVLDAARDPGVLKLVHEMRAYESLFDGEELADVAPYIVAVPPAMLERVVAKAWGKSWGVLFTSSYPLVAIHRHLQRLLDAQTEDGTHYMFRFYDPRVLRVIVPACTPEEIDELLGPIDRFVIEGRIATCAHEVARAETVTIGVAA
jgi:hypothetical protein